jgi:16S rRNA (cytidine1402-2'-O)-methyltransferase
LPLSFAATIRAFMRFGGVIFLDQLEPVMALRTLVFVKGHVVPRGPSPADFSTARAVLPVSGVSLRARLAAKRMPDNAKPGRQQGELYLVSTPIGNLEDITLRALRVLKEADVIACEDTRHTQKLLSHYEIKNRVVSYHEHNETARAAELAAEIEQGARIALVSDAGTPMISDPGHRLVALCVSRGITVIPVPGPSAVIAALAASGMPAETFLFAGFLPARAGARRRALKELAGPLSQAALAITLILYEAPHRVAAMLADAAEILGPRPATIARELTKIHEEFLRGTLPELVARLRERPLRGEITLLIGPPEQNASRETPALPAKTTLAKRVSEIMREQSLDRKAALKQAAREFGINRREAYKRLLVERG